MLDEGGARWVMGDGRDERRKTGELFLDYKIKILPFVAMIRARQPFYPLFKNTTTPICTLPVVLLPCQFHGRHLLYRYLSKPFFFSFFI